MGSRRHESIDPGTMPHGTRGRYVGGCRCEPCRASNLGYYHQRMARRRAAEASVCPSGPPRDGSIYRAGVRHRVKLCPGANGKPCVRGGAWLRGAAVCKACVEHATVWNGLVSAAPTREHLMKLRRCGVGRRSVAAACDVAETLLVEVLTGRQTHVRADVERRVLAVDAGARADGSLVTAQAVKRQLAEMRAAGFTLRHLAELLGLQGNAPQLGARRRATARSRQRVQRLYARWQRGEISPSSRLVDAGPTVAALRDLVARGLDRAWLVERLDYTFNLRQPPARIYPENAAAVRALCEEIETRRREGDGLPDGWQAPSTSPASAWGFDGGWSVERRVSRKAKKREAAELRQLARPRAGGD